MGHLCFQEAILAISIDPPNMLHLLPDFFVFPVCTYSTQHAVYLENFELYFSLSPSVMTLYEYNAPHYHLVLFDL